MYSVYVKDNLKLFVGVVEGEPERIEHNGVTKMVVTLRDYQGERVKVYFANEGREAGRAKMLADRVVNAKIHDGVFLTVLASCKDPEEKTATGLDFKYRGVWNFKNGEKVTTVLMGIATRPRNPKPGMFCVTVPAEEYKDGAVQTIWIDVTFFDSDNGEKKRNSASSAQKCMFGEEKPMVVITGSDIRENVYNEHIYHNMIGYRMTKKPE